MHPKPHPRIVSLVPSWTETLLACGINVVGRTRYCKHPSDMVARIPIVGGTKEADWNLVKGLNADLVVFDQEENTLPMAEACPIPKFISRVTSIRDITESLQQLARKISSPALLELANRYQVMENTHFTPSAFFTSSAILTLNAPKFENLDSFSQFAYLIWANPWMLAANNTFIGSVLEKFRITLNGKPSEPLEKYPKISIAELPKDTLFLCSTEPFPFHKDPAILASIPNSKIIVDGEAISWFGIRNLRFLEEVYRSNQR